MFNLSNITRISFFIIVISAPIQWVSIVEIAGLSIKFVHLSIIPIFLCLLFSDFRKTVQRFFYFNRWMILCFFLLMVVNFVFTCINATNQDIGFSYIAKNLSYLLYFIAFGSILLYECSKENFYKEIAISNFLCSIIFLFMAELIFLSLGRNFLGELISNFLKGDSIAIRYDIFYKLFNAHGVSGNDEYQTNLRNTLLGGFIYVHFTSLYSLRISKNRYINLLNWFSIGFGTFLVIASTSRSNMLVLVLGYVIFILLSLYSNKLVFKPSYLYIFLVVVFLSIVFSQKIISFFGNSSSMISNRISQLSEDARWEVDAEALNYFENHLFVGKGSGAVLSNGYRVHNFVLGSAYQTGILGFVLSLAFYLGIIFSVIRSSKLLRNRPNLYWFVALTSLPLLRSMTSGNSGTLTIIEWFCLAFFFCIVMLEKQHKNLYSFTSSASQNFNGNKVYI